MNDNINVMDIAALPEFLLNLFPTTKIQVSEMDGIVQLAPIKYNAETEAAILEARGIMSGRIAAKTYNSVAEMNADIDAMPDEV